MNFDKLLDQYRKDKEKNSSKPRSFVNISDYRPTQNSTGKSNNLLQSQIHKGFVGKINETPKETEQTHSDVLDFIAESKPAALKRSTSETIAEMAKELYGNETLEETIAINTILEHAVENKTSVKGLFNSIDSKLQKELEESGWTGGVKLKCVMCSEQSGNNGCSTTKTPICSGCKPTIEKNGLNTIKSKYNDAITESDLHGSVGKTLRTILLGRFVNIDPYIMHNKPSKTLFNNIKNEPIERPRGRGGRHHHKKRHRGRPWHRRYPYHYRRRRPFRPRRGRRPIFHRRRLYPRYVYHPGYGYYDPYLYDPTNPAFWLNIFRPGRGHYGPYLADKSPESNEESINESPAVYNEYKPVKSKGRNYQSPSINKRMPPLIRYSNE